MLGKIKRQLLERGRPGFALMNVMMVLAVMTLGLVTTINYTNNAYRASRKITYETQAYNIARAGLVDTIAWFKRQKAQPVEAFTPQKNGTNPLKWDTHDPYLLDPGEGGAGKDTLGIVQEFEIDKDQNLWARYEVGKITRLTKDDQGKLRNYMVCDGRDADGKRIWKLLKEAVSDKWEGVEDLTEDYGLQGKGLLWRIRAHGYVYRKDPNAGGAWFYQYPNEVLEHVELDTEIFRLQVRDYGAAIVGNKGEDIIIRNSGGVSGGDGYALMWNVGAPTPSAPTSLITSNLSNAYRCVTQTSGEQPAQPANTLDWYEVFGVSDGSVIANLADFKGTDHTCFTYPQMAITYIKPADGQVEFHDTRWGPNHKTLNGGGILVVDGDMLVENWGANTWNGVIYVTGNLKITCLTNFVGETIVKGKIDWRPTDIEYNPNMLTTVRQRLAQYRERRAAIKVSSED